MLHEKECEWCHKKFETKEKRTRFCSYECSARYSNNKRKENGTNRHSEETRKKISESLLKFTQKYGQANYNKNGERYFLPKKKKIKICKVCGQEICKYPDICKQYLLRKKSINLQKLGFDISKIGTPEIYDEYFKLNRYLLIEYNVKENSLRSICDKHNMTCETSLCKIMDMYGIKRNDQSYSHVLSFKHNRCKPLTDINITYKHGFHTTWDNNQVYYRSSYELEYCKYLDSKKIHYEMEYLRIPYFDSEMNRLRIAIPDFYIPSKNLLIEIKGDYTYSKQNMIDRFRAYKQNGYDYQLVLEGKNYGKKLPVSKEQHW